MFYVLVQSSIQRESAAKKPEETQNNQNKKKSEDCGALMYAFVKHAHLVRHKSQNTVST